MAETEPKWRKGTDKTTCGKQAVVTDCHPGCKCDTDTIEAYGGHLICESVETKYRGLIAAAPDLLEAAKAGRKYFQVLRAAWESSDGCTIEKTQSGNIATVRGEVGPHDLDALFEDWAAKTTAAIAKAES